MKHARILSLVICLFMSGNLFGQNLNLIYNGQHNSQRKADVSSYGKRSIDSLYLPIIQQVIIRDSIMSKYMDAMSAMAAKYKLDMTGTNINKTQLMIPTDSIVILPTLSGDLTGLKKQYRSAQIDSLREILSNMIDSVKLNNSLDFLSSDRMRIKPFSLFNIGMYNIDTINDYLYSQSHIDFFQSASFEHYGTSTNYIKSELMSFLFGPIRMGISGSFKASGDTAKDDSAKMNLQRILNNGGALSLNFSTPLLFTRDRSEQVHFGIFAQNNFAFTPTNQQTFSGTFLFNAQSGFIFHLDLGSNFSSDASQSARLSFDVPILYVYGSQDTYNAIGQSDFFIAQAKVGLVVKDQFTFYVSGPIWSSSKSVQNTGWQYSIKFSPSQLINN